MDMEKNPYTNNSHLYDVLNQIKTKDWQEFVL